MLVALGLGAASCSSGNGPGSAARTTTTAHGAPRVPASLPTTTSTTAATPSTSTTTTAASAQPTLGIAGPWPPSASGFGQVKPAEINLGGDPTGIVTGITWQSWGGSMAMGTGTGTYVGQGQTTAQGSPQTATVVAFSLGTCGGAPAYQMVEWYFASEGETPGTAATTQNACTGP
jgi:hypothetical protein